MKSAFRYSLIFLSISEYKPVMHKTGPFSASAGLRQV